MRAIGNEIGNKIVIVVCLILIMTVGAFWIHDLDCDVQWKDSGMKSDYTLLGGCRVQRTDGTWVPAFTMRNIGH